MDRISGLPSHPLLVHIPVAFLPLAAVGVGVMLVKRAWYERYRWAVLFVGFVGMIGAIIATSTGEGLEHMLTEAEGAEVAREIHEHAEAGELARTAAIVFFVVLAAWVIIPWFLERRATTATVATDAGAAAAPVKAGPTWLRPVLMVLTALAAVFSMVTVIDAGHSGASQAWEELDSSGSGDHDD